MDYSGIHPWRDHDAGCLQKEGSAPTAATSTTAAGAYRVHHGESEQRG